MKRSIRSIYTITALTLITPLYAPLQTRLPNNFYLFNADQSGPHASTLFDDTIPPKAIIIFVGNNNALPSKDTITYMTMQRLFKDLTLPDELLPNLRQTDHILKLYFDWEDKVGFKNIREFGAVFAKGITELTNKYVTIPVIITLGRAGLMVNFASNQWHTSIPSLPLIVQIGTPVPPREELYADLFPKTQNFRRLFQFYCTQPFIVDQPTLHPTYQPAYSDLPPLSTYNLLVLFNNNQPLQHKLLDMQLLTNNILDFCKKTQFSFVANKQLFINLSPRKPETHGLIGITQTNTKNTSEQNKKELELNNSVLKTFTQEWSYGPRLTIPTGEYLRNSYKFHNA